MSEMDKRLSDIESQRLELEDNIAKLRKSLQHWQTWDAEYEALKEELQDTVDFDGDELSRIQHDFDGELVTAKEIDEIFGRQKLRSKAQIVDVLDRRIDYVTDNLRTLRKQLGAAEEKLAETLDDADPDTDGKEGELTEIMEELDDDDNVLSYQLKTPSQALPHVQEALKKAGVEDRSDVPAHVSQSSSSGKSSELRVIDVSEDADIEDTAESNATKSEDTGKKKNVAFTEDTKMGDDRPQPTSRNARRVEQIMQTAKDQEGLMKQNPIIPEDEDPEDAAMRQAMLNYSMREVGAIVAEMELEEVGSDEDDYEFEYSDLEEEEDDDDDAFGRYRGRVVTADYQERMLELEKKLGVRSRFTEAAERRAEEESDSDNDGVRPGEEGIGRIKISGKPAGSSATKAAPVKSSMKKDASEQPKGVRFAQALDIAPEEESKAPAAPLPSAKDQKDIVEPMLDTIVERKAPSQAAEPTGTSTRKQSRFKQNRAQGGPVPQGPFDVPASVIERNAQELPVTPTGPSGTTIADTLVERETNSQPVPPDEFDDSMIQDEVADEYQRMRKRFINRDGGFLRENESQVQPLEEAHGGPQRMSRFKAARLSRQ
ncbi:prefoldin subunit domain-containing protein [Sarocladium implicatum]|nr:prefoldin subunit domain-containing protein [Sarocladium implicatum]